MAFPRMPDMTSGNFVILIDGFEPMSVTSVTGLGFEVMVLEDHESRGSAGQAPHRSAGLNKVTPVVISTVELEKAFQLGAWRSEVEVGTINRKNVTIHMKDAAGIPVMGFHLREAWPSSISINSVPQSGEGWIQVDIALVHEGIKRELM
jgi:phage tail-like protein